ncbi:MAG: FprA family A-type flavoprotein, partial [Candidatus Thermoplasmatota archaeon]|nr:FprA family A-type flavoprotein [Candidatus Thermoplasmatota archaeon]
MEIKKITAGVYAAPAKHWDRRLFDELIPLPEGTSYNAYIVKGDKKTALIDTVDPSKQQELLDALQDMNVNIDYIVANHAEQDHSGSIPAVLERYPNAKVACTQKCKVMLIEHLLINEDLITAVDDGSTLPLGGKTLEFIHMPWVHWPETMSTYLREDHILFSCDFLGSHIATSDLFVKNKAEVYDAAKRYYAEIMMPFRIPIRKNLEKIKDLHIDIIAPSHGPLYDKPEIILDAYRDWVSDDVKNEVVIPFVSMHGSTAVMVDYLVDALIKRGINVRPFNLPVTDIGELAMALVDAATIVIGTPTVLAGPHPNAVYAAYLANALRPKTRFASIIGSYGWGGKMTEDIKGLIKSLKVELIEPVVIKGYPKENDFRMLDRLAD